VTGVIDAGGGFQNYPDDYAIIEKLHKDGQLTVRISYNLFTQKPKEELADFAGWVKQVAGPGRRHLSPQWRGRDAGLFRRRFRGFPRRAPDMPPSMEGDLEPVIRLLAENRWPWRLHATYDETIGRALDVYEKVNRDIPLTGINWFFDHAETISDRNIDRIAALGGGIAVQHRMAYQGEYFVERYGAKAAEPRRRSQDDRGGFPWAPAPMPPAWPATTLGVAVLAGHRPTWAAWRSIPAPTA
jgi:predicted amidohydrolase YtcJ